MTDMIPILRTAINRPTTINVSGFVAREIGRFISNANRESINRVIQAVCDVFGLPSEALASRSQWGRIVWPRQIAMSLCYHPPEVSLSDVGMIFGRTGHDAALYSIKRVKERCELEPKCREQFEQVKGRLK